MRQTLLFLLAFFPVFSYCQLSNYLPDGATWRIDRTGLSSQSDCWYKDQIVCTITGDTVIGQYQYKKLMTHGYYQEFGISMGANCTSPYVHDEPYALLRQDSLTIRIWDNDQDVLLYDFDLQVGDLLPLTYNNYNDSIAVNSISTIQIGNDQRKVFHLSNNDLIDTLIEGLGHNWGLIGTMQPFEFFETDLKCFALNDTTWYPYLDAPCDYNLSTEKIEETEIVVYPNPTNDFWGIKLPAGTKMEDITVCDVAGQLQQLHMQHTGLDLVEVDAHNLPAGMYLLKLRTTSGSFLRMRLMKTE